MDFPITAICTFLKKTIKVANKIEDVDFFRLSKSFKNRNIFYTLERKNYTSIS